MKKAINNNDLKEIKAIKELSKNSKKTIAIDNKSPLDYALSINKDELAIKMMKEGFTLNFDSKVNSNKVNKAIENIMQRRSSGYNKMPNNRGATR